MAIHDFLTASEDADRLRRLNTLRFTPRSGKRDVVIQLPRMDRWVNWDHVVVGDYDWYDEVEFMDECRKRKHREQEQMDSLRRVHERRVSKIKIDREKFMSEEPYSFMCKIPVA